MSHHCCRCNRHCCCGQNNNIRGFHQCGFGGGFGGGFPIIWLLLLFGLGGCGCGGFGLGGFGRGFF
jgi:hypothetical protein